ncbi:MAG TPA: hypothetical protein VLU94_01270, partial [Candidatus Nitrosotalea sp.]|nr:hypothetical protein [Candidatus Nitrosotalea sp.]
RTLESERAWGDRIIDWTRNNRHKHAFDELADFPLQSNSGSELVDFMFRVCPSGWFDLEKLNYNRMFEELVMTGFDPQKRRIDPAVCASNQQRLEESFSSLHGLISNHAVFARLLIPALTRVTQRFALGQCNVDQAVIACALERYRLVEGHYPDALDSLVPRFMASLPRDVITGDPLKYRRTGDEQFLLYSVGWNGKDDGGTIVPVKGSRSESQDITQGDWVWRFPNTQP